MVMKVGTAIKLNLGVRVIPTGNEWYDRGNPVTEENPASLDTIKRYDFISVGERGVMKISGMSRDEVYGKAITERITDPLSEIFVKESKELRRWPA